MLQAAAEADIEVGTPQRPQDGKCEVLFPEGLPDEGTFDWLDGWMKDNPGYTELSSRALLDWAMKSGLRRLGGNSRVCNDRPGMDLGIRDLDNDSIHNMIMSVAPLLKRNFVIMEVRNNLLASERKRSLAHFDPAAFKRKALVVMGEPPEEHKSRVRQLTLEDKKRRATVRPPPPAPSRKKEEEA